MAYRYTVLPFVCLIHLACFAQPGVLNGSEMLPPGSVFVQRVMQDVDVLDTTIQGQNVVWDFTDITPLTSEQPFNNEVMLPANTPHPTTFPAANYVIYETEIPRYSYFAITPTSMSRVGGWVDEASIYSDPQIEMLYPMAYGVHSEDTWDNNMSGVGGGTYVFRVIGTGALHLPGHTYSDVLMVRGDLHEFFDLNFYCWYDATNGTPLLMYYPADGFWVPEGTAAYATNVTVGVDEVTDELGLRIHTLVQQQLPVTYSATQALDWTIVDVAGHVQGQGHLPASTTPITAFLDLNGAAAGTYLVVLANERGRKAERFVVE